MDNNILEYIKQIFIYSEKSPLIFTRLYFWIFFALVLTFYTFLSKASKLRSTYMLIVSLFFYYKSSGLFLLILIFSTFFDFYVGNSMFKSKNQTNRKLLLALSVSVNLLMLFYFKYAYFFTNNYNAFFHTNYAVINHFAYFANTFTGSHFEVGKILLPVGVSFFTFQTISYSVDIFRKKIEPVKSILDFGFFVSFFPQLVAGPIVRAADFIPQIYKDFKLSKQEFGYAVFIILSGLTKKLFIADYIAVNFVDRVFKNPYVYSGFENLMATFGYSLQIYCDFSGYTDIAIGVALLMGFRLNKNFNSPYKAQNVGDFWRRWHISLSTWLRDYLYIPLGGNRKGKFMANVNLMITMLLGGLWHGASWQFVIWGGLNGIAIVIYKFWRKISPWEKSNKRIAVVWKITLTFCFITFTRVWFRSSSMDIVNEIFHQITSNFKFYLIPKIIISYYPIFLMMLLGYILHWLPYTLKDKIRNYFIESSLAFKVVITAIVIVIIFQSLSSDLQPFIYFQF